MRQALQKVLDRDGMPGLYRGFLPNALKNLPNKGMCCCNSPAKSGHKRQRLWLRCSMQNKASIADQMSPEAASSPDPSDKCNKQRWML